MKEITPSQFVPARARNKPWASLAIGSCAVFAVAIALLHVLRPDLIPVSSFVSQYLNGPYAELMVVAFLAIGTAQVALAIAFYRNYVPPLRPTLAALLLAITGLGTIPSAFFTPLPPGVNPELVSAQAQTADMLHDLVGLAGFVIGTLASILLANWLRKAGLLSGGYRALFWLALLMPLLFLLMFFTADGPAVGVVQRLFLLALLSWLLLAASGIRSGAITASSG